MRRATLQVGALLAASFLITLAITTPGGIQPRDSTRLSLARDSPHSNSPDAPAIAGTEGTAFDMQATLASAAGAGSIEERIQALQELGETPDPDAVGALSGTSINGADPLERAAAVTALRRQLRTNAEDSRIRSALQSATMDPDPMVVVLAQSALESVEARP